MRFKKLPQLPGAGRTRAGHHHGNHTPTSPEAVLLGKTACQPKHFGRQCMCLSYFITTVHLIKIINLVNKNWTHP